MYIFSNACTCFCIFCRCIKIRYGDPDIIGCKLLIIFLKYKAKDQDRLGDPCMPKLQCLLCSSCCKSPDIVIVLDQTGNSSGTMAITVCLITAMIFVPSLTFLCISSKLWAMASSDTSAFTLFVFFHNPDSSSPIANALGRYSMISPASILRFPFSAAARSPQSP